MTKPNMRAANAAVPADSYGVLTEPATLTLRRLLPGPIERVWAYLTESDLRRQWLAEGEMELKLGSSFTFTWRNNDLTDPPGERPDGISGEHGMECQITALDPPRLLSFTWGRSGGVTFQLEPQGDAVLLTVIHRRLPDRSTMLMVGPGWHAHLDLLVARISGIEPAPFWDQWQSLKRDYEARLSA